MHTQIQKQPNAIASAVAAAFPDVPPPRPVYVTVSQFSERNTAFSESSLRNLIFKAELRESTKGIIPGNGLLEHGAVVRLGRKVLINEERFLAWVEAHGGAR